MLDGPETAYLWSQLSFQTTSVNSVYAPYLKYTILQAEHPKSKNRQIFQNLRLFQYQVGNPTPDLVWYTVVKMHSHWKWTNFLQTMYKTNVKHRLVPSPRYLIIYIYMQLLQDLKKPKSKPLQSQESLVCNLYSFLCEVMKEYSWIISGIINPVAWDWRRFPPSWWQEAVQSVWGTFRSITFSESLPLSPGSSRWWSRGCSTSPTSWSRSRSSTWASSSEALRCPPPYKSGRSRFCLWTPQAWVKIPQAWLLLEVSLSSSLDCK